MQEEIIFRPLEARIYLNDGVFCAISDATSDLFDVVQVAMPVAVQIQHKFPTTIRKIN